MKKRKTFKLVNVLGTTTRQCPEYSIFARYEGKEFQAKNSLAAKRKVGMLQNAAEYQLLQALKETKGGFSAAFHSHELFDCPKLEQALIEVKNE